MKINRSDLRTLSYGEFGSLLETLTENVVSACQERALRVDIVSPILRSGGFTGCHLASKLGVTNIVPLQYRHTYDTIASVQQQFYSPALAAEPQGTVVILMVDTNTVTGAVAQQAAEVLRMTRPSSRILFASMMLDLSIEHLKHVEFLISAKRTNERRTVSCELAQVMGVSNEVYVFPWEDLDEQWAEIQKGEAETNK
jgi:hypoxanthine phosphoribosyltransferase